MKYYFDLDPLKQAFTNTEEKPLQACADECMKTKTVSLKYTVDLKTLTEFDERSI